MEHQNLEELASVGKYKLVKVLEQGKDTIFMLRVNSRRLILIDHNTVLPIAYAISYFGDEKNKDDHGYPTYISEWTGKYASPSIHTQQCKQARASLKAYGLLNDKLEPTPEIKELGKALFPILKDYLSSLRKNTVSIPNKKPKIFYK